MAFRRVSEIGHKERMIRKRYGVSRSTAYRWAHKYSTWEEIDTAYQNSPSDKTQYIEGVSIKELAEKTVFMESTLSIYAGKKLPLRRIMYMDQVRRHVPLTEATYDGVPITELAERFGAPLNGIGMMASQGVAIEDMEVFAEKHRDQIFSGLKKFRTYSSRRKKGARMGVEERSQKLLSMKI